MLPTKISVWQLQSMECFLKLLKNGYVSFLSKNLAKIEGSFFNRFSALSEEACWHKRDELFCPLSKRCTKRKFSRHNLKCVKKRLFRVQSHLKFYERGERERVREREREREWDRLVEFVNPNYSAARFFNTTFNFWIAAKKRLIHCSVLSSFSL